MGDGISGGGPRGVHEAGARPEPSWPGGVAPRCVLSSKYSIGKIPSIIFGGFEFPLPTVKKKYDILIIGDVHIPVEVT